MCVCVGGDRRPQPWPPALDPEGLLLSLGLGSSPGPRRPALCRVPAAAAHHWMMPRCRPRLPAGEAGTASAMAPAGCSRAASGRAAPVPSALFTLELGRARGNHAGEPCRSQGGGCWAHALHLEVRVRAAHPRIKGLRSILPPRPYQLWTNGPSQETRKKNRGTCFQSGRALCLIIN